MAEIQKNPKMEKDRSLKILNWMQKADEVKHRSKADAHLVDADKVVQNKIKRKEKKRSKGKN